MTELINLPQLEIEIKFYLGQTAQNIIEVGKRLIQAKSLVQHGQWQDWLQNNFQLSYRTAKNFIDCAEQFSNVKSIATLNSTQMIALLSLPDAAETEKFIAEKAAEGKKVDEMTIKQLREEIAEYKKTIEQKDKDFQQSLFNLGKENKKVLDEQEEKYQQQLANLKKELKDRPTNTVDLFNFIRRNPSHEIKHTNENQHGQASFITVKWDDLKRSYTMMTVTPADVPDSWSVSWRDKNGKNTKIIRRE